MSLAAHAAVLAGYWSGPGHAPSGRPSSSVVTARLVIADDAMGGATDTPAVATGLESAAIAPEPAPEPAGPAPILSRAPAESLQAPPPAPAASAVATPEVAKPAEAMPIPAETLPVGSSHPVGSYLPSSGLDVAPRPLDDIDPLIPEEARGRPGSVVLQLFISAQGMVDRVEVLHSNPPGLFDASVVAAATRVRFSPGYVAGVAVDSQVTREVMFQGKGSGKDTAGRGY